MYVIVHVFNQCLLNKNTKMNMMQQVRFLNGRSNNITTTLKCYRQLGKVDNWAKYIAERKHIDCTVYFFHKAFDNPRNTTQSVNYFNPEMEINIDCFTVH